MRILFVATLLVAGCAPTPQDDDSTSAAVTAGQGIDACYGDGVHDDTACLNDAINATGATTITFAVGRTYLVTGGLWVPAGRTLVGNQSRIELVHPTTTSYISILQIAGDSVSVSGLWLDYEVPSTFRERLADIQVRSDAHHIKIENNYLTGAAAESGILIDGSNISDVTIDSNTIVGTGFGILVNAENLGTNPAAYPQALTITNNHITEVNGDAIEVNSPVIALKSGSQIAGVAVTNVTISNNILSAPGSTSSGAGFCIGLAGVTSSLVSNNTMSDCKWQGIHIEDEANKITLSGNHVQNVIGVLPGDDAGWRGNTSGILVLHSNAIFVYDNWIENSPSDGIELSYDGTFYDTNCDIAGNYISNSGMYGIYVGGKSDQPVDTWIGPVAGHAANTTAHSTLGSIEIAGNPLGTSAAHNTGD